MTDQSHVSERRPPGERVIALVDGSNVAHSSEGDGPRLANIRLVVEQLRSDGMEPIVVADAALRHQIDERAEYERMVDAGEVKQAPAGTDADYFLLAFARDLDALIVTNDLFRDRMSGFPDAKKRLVKYMILNEEVVLEKRTSRRR